MQPPINPTPQVTPNAENAFRQFGPEEDRKAILHVHNEWWEANRDMDIPRMRACFAGPMYYQFNLTGHPYYSLDEKTALWEALKDVVTMPEIGARDFLRMEVHGDMAWLACEVVVQIDNKRRKQRLETGELDPDSKRYELADSTAMRIRATEVYQRDDGEGRPEWRIWHYHCSRSAPDDQWRVPFKDTYPSRLAG